MAVTAACDSSSIGAEMVLCCDITFEGRDDEIFVLLPHGLYVLPDEQLVDLSATIVWCDDCVAFQAGELIEPRESILKLIDDAESGTLEEPYRLLYGSDQEKCRKAIASWKRRLLWRENRVSPPRCLHCGSIAIREVDASDPESLVEPSTGTRIAVSHLFASTGIDLRLSVFTAEGEFLGEISRVAPKSREFIDDSSPYSTVMAILNESNREA